MITAAERKRTVGDNHLPPEIWRGVLAGLPAKSILRCRSVCKSWYSLVSCPSFVSYYSTKTLNKTRNRVLLHLCDGVCEVTMSFSSVDESFMESREHDDFPELHALDIHIVGSCDGLVFLYKPSKYGSSGITLFVWNPAIGKVVEIPYRDHGEFPCYIGFGFDSKTIDYKVMCVISNVCEIFDLRKGVWRSIGPLKHPWRGESIFSECYLDGAVHWCKKKQHGRHDMILVSFDMSDECFRHVKMPDFADFTTIRSVTLGGLIYVFAWNTTLNCSVWVMKEYGVAESWTKVSNMDLPGNHIWSHAYILWENGEVLMAEEVSGVRFKHNLVLYNMKRNKYERVYPIT